MRILVTLVLLYFLTRSDLLQKKLGNGLQSKIINRHYFRDSSFFSLKISSHYAEVKKALILVFETYLLCRIYTLWEHVSGNCHRRMIESGKRMELKSDHVSLVRALFTCSSVL